MKKFQVVVLIIISFILSNNVFAKDLTIEMLNKSGKEIMIYSKKIARVNVGEKIFWKATDKGHNVEFIKNGTPAGVDKFKSKMNKDVEYQFKIPGIYAYWCSPHKGLGMIGFIVVGNNKSNLSNIKSIKFFGKSKKLAAELIKKL